ncbi:MAG: murein L,D-transpeptidase, partial [Hyphomonadaceae bacterium]|nr:murein L,D-transpeptidase [Hyphomonadaceae bacterium]
MTWKAAILASVLLLLASDVLVAGHAMGPGHGPFNGPFNGHGADGAGTSQGPSGDGQQGVALDLADLKRRLADKGAALGSPMLIRIFKSESELELWVRREDRFELFATYPICNWSGALGPKLAEGDKQSPEGLYSVGPRQLHRSGRWRRSLDIGFPNTFDRAHGRTGSYILVHGGCTSTGCYAMTNPVMEEIFTLSEAALAGGQERIQVHVFPFRMTQENMAAQAQSPWSGFWLSLKDAYDEFNATRLPPAVSVCDNRYVVGAAAAGSACLANVSEVSVASARLKNVRRVARARHTRRARLARRTVQVRQAQRASGRNVR